MEQDVFATNLALMANAVRICQMDPGKCSPTDRKEAENFLIQLRSTIEFPIKFSEYVLEATDDDSVRYHAVALFKEAILKDWSKLDTLEIEHGWKYLLNFSYNHAPLIPVFLSNELLQTVAMIVKRGTFDGKSGETDKIYELVLDLISSRNVTLQTDLKKIFELSLRVLHDLTTGSWHSRDQTVLTCRFLNLAVCILTWNFGSKYLPKGLTCCLHSQVRSSENDPCTSSIHCLVQLASLCGVIFPNDAARDKYLNTFITSLLNVFSDGVNEWEIVNFSEIILKLFTYHALGTFRRLDSNLAVRFFEYVATATCSFCQKAARESLLECDDTIYQEAFAKLLEGWTIQLKAEERLEKNENGSKTLTDHAKRVFDCYLNCHLSKYNDFVANGVPHEKEMNELTEDDKERFVEVLHYIGIFGRHCAGEATNRLIELIGKIFRWVSIECDFMRNGKCSLLSPQVAETASWSLRRILNAFCETDERYSSPPAILCPLKARYEYMINILMKNSNISTPNNFTTSDLLDVLDCFSGLLQGIGSKDAKALFQWG
uniref:Exportin-4 n=1 Tax=Romanomermis culicivorax TaxID=13658 RepID=A0A915J6I8_ROMCU